MKEKFRGKYRSESARLKNWDYGSDAAYFITICTKDRIHFFGEIENGKMQVTSAGAIAHVLWHEIKNHAKNVELGEFVVMPNHVHGILILQGNDKYLTDDRRDVARNVSTNVPTDNATPKTTQIKNDQMATISPSSNTISSIIRSYKSAVTKYCNRLELPMAWQPRFHDHIIRNDESFQRITAYIINNPAKWP
ncbi:transposase [Acidiluteibacter ferrifornacis]|uniref:Transposase n=1 Tax=Acidiluteibacter ferrifornacis TaxID=2692424 RepID=A0A6N9NSL8_9FLAO|nr:transposase [Acidiluteibacter ferrifornacis]NBG67375.1 transposase [Acidiluteibacter ferrifornacis]